MSFTPNMPNPLQNLANQQEQDKRDAEQKQFIKLSEAAKLYKAALDNTVGLSTWYYEEFDPNETEEEKEARRAREDFVGFRSGNPEEVAADEIKEGIYTRKGATKGVVFRDGSLSPHGNQWTTGFDKNGWNEVFEFARQKLGCDTVEFEIADPKASSKFFGFQANHTRRLAIRQLEGILEMAKEKGMAVELGPNARRLVREMAQDDDYKGKFKDKTGKLVHYEHKIDEQLQYLKDNKDYQNMKMEVGNAELQKFNKEVEPAFNQTTYISDVYQKLDKDGRPVTPKAEETDIKLRSDAAEKAIKNLEARVKANDEVIAKLDAVQDIQGKMIEKSDVKQVLEEIGRLNETGTPARLERDQAVSKIDTRITTTNGIKGQDVQRIEKLETQVNTDIRNIKAGAAARPEAERALNDKEKEAIAKNETLLESLKTLKANMDGQKTKLDGIKDWENVKRGEAIEERIEKIEARATARPSH